MKKFLPLVLTLFLTACVGVPEGVKPVENFKLDRYLGTWYEIARLDHRFERGLSRISADYSLREDGGIRVLNRGYSAEDKEWKEAKGNAYFVEGPDKAYLKVSFFWLVYGSYVVFEVDHEHYQYALVSGPDKSYLWILSRIPEMKPDIKYKLIAKANALGFDTGKLIFVDHR